MLVCFSEGDPSCLGHKC